MSSPRQAPRRTLATVLVAGATLALGLAVTVQAHATPSSALSAVDVGADTLLFHRSLGDNSRHEGFVVDQQLLFETLKARVVEARGLSDSVTVLRARPDADAFPATDDSLAVHQFAPPFQSLAVALRLPPLAEPDASATLLQLAALLALCLALGLFALYRMAATEMAFAERRSNFVAAVTHELRTPLTAIRMHAEMLRDGLVADEQRVADYHHTITAQSERLSRLIDNVLELSRIEQTHPRPLIVGDIGAVVAAAVEALRPHVEASGHRLELELHPPIAQVMYDADALQQVLFNLIENAIKYGQDADEQRITVACRKTSRGLKLSVRDRGPGVEPKHLPLVFEPFYRGEQELTRRHAGTGIGLSLVKGLVERMGGQVEARNTEPGFEVVLLLPSAT